MSYTTSAMLSRAQSTVAIFGATGSLGQVIAETFLTTFKPFFSRVVVISRSTSSSKAQSLAALGAELIQTSFDEKELLEALKGIDIVVNALGSTELRTKDAIAEAVVGASVAIYFPSEFGIDHRFNDFPGFDHIEWDKKRKHVEYANELKEKKGIDMKIISVYCGLFLESSLRPHFGFDHKSRKVVTIGPASSRSTYTSKTDIARSVAQLSILAMLSPATLSDSVPDYVHVAGCTKSAGEIAEMLGYEIQEVDIHEAREDLKRDHISGNPGPPAQHIRVLMGEGKLDFSGENVNELVNPHQRLWHWTSVERIIREKTF